MPQHGVFCRSYNLTIKVTDARLSPGFSFGENKNVVDPYNSFLQETLPIPNFLFKKCTLTKTMCIVCGNALLYLQGNCYNSLHSNIKI